MLDGFIACVCNVSARFAGMIRIGAFRDFKLFQSVEVLPGNAQDAQEDKERACVSDCKKKKKTRRTPSLIMTNFQQRYTENSYFTELEEEDRSEISRTNIAHVVLTLMTLNVKNVIEWDYLERCVKKQQFCLFQDFARPHLDSLRSALEELVVLGALDKSMILTPIGKTMSVFPVEPNLAKVRL